MTAGGKRAGAGRKPRQVAKVALSIRLEPEVAEKLERIRKYSCGNGSYKKSQSAMIAELIEWAEE